jgi:hypothetical protein
VYGAMDDVFQFVATLKEFPPRSFPPSFPLHAMLVRGELNGAND